MWLTIAAIANKLLPAPNSLATQPLTSCLSSEARNVRMSFIAIAMVSMRKTSDSMATWRSASLPEKVDSVSKPTEVHGPKVACMVRKSSSPGLEIMCSFTLSGNLIMADDNWYLEKKVDHPTHTTWHFQGKQAKTSRYFQPVCRSSNWKNFRALSVPKRKCFLLGANLRRHVNNQNLASSTFPTFRKLVIKRGRSKVFFQHIWMAAISFPSDSAAASILWSRRLCWSSSTLLLLMLNCFPREIAAPVHPLRQKLSKTMSGPHCKSSAISGKQLKNDVMSVTFDSCSKERISVPMAATSSRCCSSGITGWQTAPRSSSSIILFGPGCI